MAVMSESSFAAESVAFSDCSGYTGGSCYVDSDSSLSAVACTWEGNFGAGLDNFKDIYSEGTVSCPSSCPSDMSGNCSANYCEGCFCFSCECIGNPT